MRLILSFLLLVLFTSLGFAPSLNPASAWQTKVDPSLLEQASQDSVEFLLFLGEQADLSAAAQLPTKAQKGAYVYSRLNETARRTQPPLLNELNRLSFAHRSYWIAAAEPGAKVLTASCTFALLQDGDLVLENGRSFRWYRTKLLDTAWAFGDQAGGAVFEIRLGMRWFKYEASVRLWPAAQALPELGLLLCLGMYLSVCSMQDMGAVVAGTTATTG